MSTAKNLPVAPGDEIHFLESGFTFSSSDNISSGIVARRGMTVTITDDLIRASLDRNGDSWLQRVGDPNETRFASGPFPSDLAVLVPGSNEHERERERRRQVAWALPDEVDRAKALKAVQSEFGGPPSKQVSAEYRGDSAFPQRVQA